MLKKPFIKEAQTIVALLLISLGGCKKDSSDSANKNVREEFTVVETNSNVPVQGAMVTAYTCTSSGLWLCSGAGEPLDSAITNDAGKVVFNTGYGVGYLRIRKDTGQRNIRRCRPGRAFSG